MCRLLLGTADASNLIWILFMIVMVLMVFRDKAKQVQSRRRALLDRRTGMLRYHIGTVTEFIYPLVSEPKLSWWERRKRAKEAPPEPEAAAPEAELVARKEAEGSAESENSGEKKAIGVIRFTGDMRCQDHEQLAELVDEIAVNRDRFSEIVVVVSSPGGLVNSYGHAFAQMERIRSMGLELTVCVDTIAASGGYLMALPANRIVAAPFAYVGSVGVVSYAPNIRKALERLGVEMRVFTAGAKKRTVSLVDDNSEEVRSHADSKLRAIHEQFLAALTKYRPNAKIEEIREADVWTAEESVRNELGLVDKLGTSSELLLEVNQNRTLILLSKRPKMLARLTGGLAASAAAEVRNLLSSHFSPLG